MGLTPATAYTPRIAGKVHSIQYIKDGTLPYTNGVGLHHHHGSYWRKSVD
jgi:hypothetical protein